MNPGFVGLWYKKQYNKRTCELKKIKDGTFIAI